MTKLYNSCGAKILDSTFQRTDGLCKPCWKDRRRKKIGETPFGIAYDTYFRQPHRLTEKYFDCWIELELTIGLSSRKSLVAEQPNTRYTEAAAR
jgi:hypothetical protein